jgi:hypothetical protein
MPTVTLAPAVARWLTASPTPHAGERSFRLTGETVRQLLDELFALHPHLRDYVVDETGGLRHHVVAFVDGTAVPDKRTLDFPVPPGGEVYLFQALSGG